jgi:hypothetical protein
MNEPDDTTPCGVPVVELDACELVTEADYRAAGLVRPVPSPYVYDETDPRVGK